ncbi:nnp-1 protein putative nuclear protein 1 nop52 [Anaeramoeba flamelloides]|uniref:Nnp-1 protein putative nuclear protein 1 nop52 n=1 Tax=Anaeramoeba flamelloides TaxID=1746091 RepID=A0AAV7Y4K2_9EUKA|nr:nnp-1 protein putative nuclear protein 1 nop52 [Anaeramoeba flamelloides]
MEKQKELLTNLYSHDLNLLTKTIKQLEEIIKNQNYNSFFLNNLIQNLYLSLRTLPLTKINSLIGLVFTLYQHENGSLLLKTTNKDLLVSLVGYKKELILPITETYLDVMNVNKNSHPNHEMLPFASALVIEFFTTENCTDRILLARKSIFDTLIKKETTDRIVDIFCFLLKRWKCNNATDVYEVCEWANYLSTKEIKNDQLERILIHFLELILRNSFNSTKIQIISLLKKFMTYFQTNANKLIEIHPTIVFIISILLMAPLTFQNQKELILIIKDLIHNNDKKKVPLSNFQFLLFPLLKLLTKFNGNEILCKEIYQILNFLKDNYLLINKKLKPNQKDQMLFQLINKEGLFYLSFFQRVYLMFSSNPNNIIALNEKQNNNIYLAKLSKKLLLLYYTSIFITSKPSNIIRLCNQMNELINNDYTKQSSTIINFYFFLLSLPKFEKNSLIIHSLINSIKQNFMLIKKYNSTIFQSLENIGNSLNLIPEYVDIYTKIYLSNFQIFPKLAQLYQKYLNSDQLQIRVSIINSIKSVAIETPTKAFLLLPEISNYLFDDNQNPLLISIAIQIIKILSKSKLINILELWILLKKKKLLNNNHLLIKKNIIKLFSVSSKYNFNLSKEEERLIIERSLMNKRKNTNSIINENENTKEKNIKKNEQEKGNDDYKEEKEENDKDDFKEREEDGEDDDDEEEQEEEKEEEEEDILITTKRVRVFSQFIKELWKCINNDKLKYYCIKTLKKYSKNNILILYLNYNSKRHSKILLNILFNLKQDELKIKKHLLILISNIIQFELTLNRTFISPKNLTIEEISINKISKHINKKITNNNYNHNNKKIFDTKMLFNFKFDPQCKFEIKNLKYIKKQSMEYLNIFKSCILKLAWFQNASFRSLLLKGLNFFISNYYKFCLKFELLKLFYKKKIVNISTIKLKVLNNIKNNLLDIKNETKNSKINYLIALGSLISNIDEKDLLYENENKNNMNNNNDNNNENENNKNNNNNRFFFQFISDIADIFNNILSNNNQNNNNHNKYYCQIGRYYIITKLWKSHQEYCVNLLNKLKLSSEYYEDNENDVGSNIGAWQALGLTGRYFYLNNFKKDFLDEIFIYFRIDLKDINTFNQLIGFSYLIDAIRDYIGIKEIKNIFDFCYDQIINKDLDLNDIKFNNYVYLIGNLINNNVGNKIIRFKQIEKLGIKFLSLLKLDHFKYQKIQGQIIESFSLICFNVFNYYEKINKGGNLQLNKLELNHFLKILLNIVNNNNNNNNTNNNSNNKYPIHLIESGIFSILQLSINIFSLPFKQNNLKFIQQYYRSFMNSLIPNLNQFNNLTINMYSSLSLGIFNYCFEIINFKNSNLTSIMNHLPENILIKNLFNQILNNDNSKLIIVIQCFSQIIKLPSINWSQIFYNLFKSLLPINNLKIEIFNLIFNKKFDHLLNLLLIDNQFELYPIKIQIILINNFQNILNSKVFIFEEEEKKRLKIQEKELKNSKNEKFKKKKKQIIQKNVIIQKKQKKKRKHHDKNRNDSGSRNENEILIFLRRFFWSVSLIYSKNKKPQILFYQKIKEFFLTKENSQNSFLFIKKFIKNEIFVQFNNFNFKNNDNEEILNSICEIISIFPINEIKKKISLNEDNLKNCFLKIMLFKNNPKKWKFLKQFLPQIIEINSKYTQSHSKKYNNNSLITHSKNNNDDDDLIKRIFANCITLKQKRKLIISLLKQYKIETNNTIINLIKRLLFDYLKFSYPFFQNIQFNKINFEFNQLLSILLIFTPLGNDSIFLKKIINFLFKLLNNQTFYLHHIEIYNSIINLSFMDDKVFNNKDLKNYINKLSIEHFQNLLK